MTNRRNQMVALMIAVVALALAFVAFAMVQDNEAVNSETNLAGQVHNGLHGGQGDIQRKSSNGSIEPVNSHSQKNPDNPVSEVGKDPQGEGHVDAEPKRLLTPSLALLAKVGRPAKLPEVQPALHAATVSRQDYVDNTEAEQFNFFSPMNDYTLRVQASCVYGDDDSVSQAPVELVRVRDGMCWRARTDDLGYCLLQVPGAEWSDEYLFRVTYLGQSSTRYLSARRCMCGELPLIWTMARRPFQGKANVVVRIPTRSGNSVSLRAQDTEKRPRPNVDFWCGTTWLGCTDEAGVVIVDSGALEISEAGKVVAYEAGWVPAFKLKGVVGLGIGSEHPVVFTVDTPECEFAVTCRPISIEEEYAQQSYRADGRPWGDILRKPDRSPFDRTSDYADLVRRDQVMGYRVESAGWYAGVWTYVRDGYAFLLPGAGSYVIMIGRRVELVRKTERVKKVMKPSVVIDVDINEACEGTASMVNLR